MKICRYGDNRVGLIEGDVVVDVTPITQRLPACTWPLPLGDLLIAHLPQLRDEMRALARSGERQPLDRVRLLSPVANPGKIIAIGRSYQAHIDEAKADPAIHHGTGEIPMDRVRMLMKANSALVGAGDGVRLRFLDRRNDPEVEIAVVIGRQVKDIPEQQALSCVAGYTLGLDMTLRGPEPPSHRKSIDSYAVLGPCLVTADEIADAQRIAFGLEVNGATWQRANTTDLRFSISEIIANASRHYTLHPGDVIMTGTPEGVASVKPGDLMSAWADGIGRMDVAVDAYSPDA